MVCTAHELRVLWQHADCACSRGEREREKKKCPVKQCKSFPSITSVLSKHVLSHQDLIKFHARNASTETDWKQQSMQCSLFVLKATKQVGNDHNETNMEETPFYIGTWAKLLKHKSEDPLATTLSTLSATKLLISHKQRLQGMTKKRKTKRSQLLCMALYVIMTSELNTDGHRLWPRESINWL